MASKVEMLAAVPLFRDLPKRTLERLDRIAVNRSFSEGEAIVKEGDEGVGFFLILEGQVDVTRGDAKLNTLHNGDFFGEMALLDNHRRSATVTATKPTTCMGLSRWDFVAELRSNPDLAVEMLQVMSRRLRELDARVSE
jgi:CRP-like cAMP-binding protein